MNIQAEGRNVLSRYRERIDAVEREIADRIYQDAERERLVVAMRYIRGESEELPSFDEEGRFGALTKIFAPLDEWTAVDERVLNVLTRMWTRMQRDHEWGFHEAFYAWLKPQIATEEEPLHPRAVEKIAARGIGEEVLLRHTIQELADVLEDSKHQPTSAGRYVLDHYPASADAMLAVGRDKRYGTKLCALLARHARGAFDAQLPKWWEAEGEWGTFQLVRALLAIDGEHYRADAERALERLKEGWPRFQVVRALYALDPGTFAGVAEKIATENLKEIQKKRNGTGGYNDAAWDSSTGRFENKTPTLVEFLLESFGRDAMAVVFDYVENTKALDLGNLEIAVKHLGQDAMPIVAEGFGVSIDDKDDVAFLSRLLRIANQIDWRSHHDEAWELVGHKSKPVREAAAFGVAKIGPSVVPRAVVMSKAKNKDQRHGAAMVLGHVANDRALEALRALVDAEKNDDVRDHALVVLDRAMQAAGGEVDDASVEARFERAVKAKKLAKAPLKWLKETALPELRWKKGGTLSAEWVRYLLYRQARQSGAEIDVELAPVLARIDTETSGDFALALWEGFLGAEANAKDKHALVVAAALGDDRVVRALSESVWQWGGSGRGALAEVGVYALARVATDEALRAIDALRGEPRGIAGNVVSAAEEAFEQAADRLGVSVEELADRVVPDLGFVRGQRDVRVGDETWKVRLSNDFRLEYLSPTGKPAKSLPRGADAALKASMKALAKDVKSALKKQREQLTAAMVLGRRWTPAQYETLILGKSLREPIAVATVWGRYAEDGALLGTFRPLGDGSLTSVGNEEVQLGATERVGIAHATELSREAREAWRTHLEEHEVIPMLPQLDRRVVACPPGLADRRFFDGVDGDEVGAGTFAGRARARGWRRGSVVDAGAISAFHRRFAPAGVDAIVLLSDLHVGGDHYGNVTLGRVMFVRDGSVSYGSYVYDEPRTDDDPRLLKLGDVPTIVYSEVVSDLTWIVGEE